MIWNIFYIIKFQTSILKFFIVFGQECVKYCHKKNKTSKLMETGILFSIWDHVFPPIVDIRIKLTHFRILFHTDKKNLCYFNHNHELSWLRSSYLLLLAFCGCYNHIMVIIVINMVSTMINLVTLSHFTLFLLCF